MHLPWHSAKWPFPGSWERTLPSAKVKTLGKVTTFAKCLSFWHVLSKVSDNSRFAGLFILFCRECFGTRQSFAECPRNGTRQTLFRCRFKRRVLFAECYTRQSFCRVYSGLRRVFPALGKGAQSGSGLCKHKSCILIDWTIGLEFYKSVIFILSVTAARCCFCSVILC